MPLPKGYTYRPLPDYLDIRPSDIEGNGLFAKYKIDALVPMGRTHIPDPGMPNGLERTPLVGHVNNSDNPNCEIYKMDHEIFGFCLYMRSIKRIAKDEELTVDYNKALCGQNTCNET